MRDNLIKIFKSSNRVNSFKMLDKSGMLKQIIPEIEAMKNVPAGNKDNHPEKDTFTHTIIVLSNLDKNASLELILATIFHDIGKPPTRRNYHFYRHANVGAVMTENILKRLNFSQDIIEKVKWLVNNHMRIRSFNEMQIIKKIKLIQHPLFNELFDLLRADIMVDTKKYIINDIYNFKQKINNKTNIKCLNCEKINKITKKYKCGHCLFQEVK